MFIVSVTIPCANRERAAQVLTADAPRVRAIPGNLAFEVLTDS